MLFRIYLLISFFSVGLLFAQSKVSNPDRETFGNVQQKGEEKKATTTSEKAVLQNIAAMEKNIASKVADLEKLQVQAIEFNKVLQKEMFIINERASEVASGHHKYLISRHVEYTFEGGSKVKEVRVVSRHKSLSNDINSIVRIVSFNPGNMESIKVTVEKFDSKVKGIAEVESYKDFTPEVKLLALKTIDTTLFNTIYRLDTYLQKNQISKIEKNKSQLEGL